MLRRMKRLLVAVLLLSACEARREAEAPPPAPAPAAAPASHEAEVMQWRQERDQRLRREDGWLTLVGLHWLKEGENTLGSAKGNRIVMPDKMAAKLGTLDLAKGVVTLKPAARSDLTVANQPVTKPAVLENDNAESGPTIVKSGPVQFYVIKRQGDRYGIRVKDAQSEARVNFKGMDYYPIDPRWRVEARFEPYNPPKQIPITDITGVTANSPSPGALVFDVAGKTYRLDPILEEGSDELFVIFKDETSKDTTYPAGRYLYTKPAGADGKVILDFNRAYNPPCVFTPFATCPLPPPQNRLPFRIEAGEKKYEGH
jgi:uncharacterized protein